MRGTDVLFIPSIFIFSKWHSLNMKHRSRAEGTRHKSVSWLQSCASLISLKEYPLPMQFTGWAAKSILLSLFPKTWRARCQLKAPMHSCPSTQLHSWPIQHKDSCVTAGPQGAVVNTKVEQELTGHLGKRWFAYRRKAGWLIWKGTWRFLGVGHVVLSPPCPRAQDGIKEPFYRLLIILDGFWHE